MKPSYRCRTCGVPIDEVPFEPCREHEAHERLIEGFQNILDGIDEVRGYDEWAEERGYPDWLED